MFAVYVLLGCLMVLHDDIGYLNGKIVIPQCNYIDTGEESLEIKMCGHFLKSK